MGVGLADGEGVGVAVGAAVGVGVAVGAAVGVGLADGVGVGVTTVPVGTGVGVAVGAVVGFGVGVGVAVAAGVGVGVPATGGGLGPLPPLLHAESPTPRISTQGDAVVCSRTLTSLVRTPLWRPTFGSHEP